MKKSAIASLAILFGLTFAGIALAQQNSGTDTMDGMMNGQSMKHAGTEMDKGIGHIPGALYTAQNTQDGVVLTITAKDPAIIKKIQASAQELAATKAAGANPDEIMICPVTNSTFKKSQAKDSVVYKGKTYYFCCYGCKPEFLKNPEKYIHQAEKAQPTAK
jgi:YHS domain-containing protein